MPETTMEKAVQPKQAAMVKKSAQPKKAVSIIPSRKEYDKAAHPAQKILRVAAYCRVSTLLEQQESSFEAQKSYYTETAARTCGNATSSTVCCRTAKQGKLTLC